MQSDFQPHYKYEPSLASEILSFDTCITPKIIKNFYFLLLLCLGMSFIFIFFSGLFTIFNGYFIKGFATIGIDILFSLIAWFVLRITMEMIILSFKNHKYLKKISERGFR